MTIGIWDLRIAHGNGSRIGNWHETVEAADAEATALGIDRKDYVVAPAPDDELVAYPNGKCYCGCDGDTAQTQFFLNGHNKVAEAKLFRAIGGLPNALLRFGLAPKR